MSSLFSSLAIGIPIQDEVSVGSTWHIRRIRSKPKDILSHALVVSGANLYDESKIVII